VQKLVLKLILVALAAIGCAGFAAVSAGAAEETGTTCSSDSSVATLSPGIEEVAKVQNITIKGTLSGCTGSTGASATYVAHLKTTAGVTCASLDAGGATSEGTVILKWGQRPWQLAGHARGHGQPELRFHAEWNGYLGAVRRPEHVEHPVGHECVQGQR
jgi:hypothetical protein